MMDEYVYGLIDGPRADRILRKIEEDPEWQLAYEAAVERKRMLAGSLRADAVGPRNAAATAQRAVGATKAVEQARLRRRRIIRRFSGGLAAAAGILIAVMWVRFATISPPRHFVRLIGQRELISGSTVSLRAIVTDFNNRPSADVPVKVVLTGGQDGASEELVLASWRTDDDGIATGRVDLPEWEGDCKLTVRAGDNRFQFIGSPIELKRTTKVFLATDKPIYQPGQTIHMRTLVLRAGSLKPDGGRPVELSVTDPSDNVIFRETRTLSEYGLAWADLPLDSLITPGRYRIIASAGDDKSEQIVEIFHYKLPAFSVKVTTHKPYYLPGETISGKVKLKYNFGKPAKGSRVELTLLDRAVAREHTLRKATVTAGDDGVANFEILLPHTLLGMARTHGTARLLLTATATDPAGQENVGYHTVPVSPSDIRITVVAESGAGDRDLPARLFVVTSYPDGRPAKSIVNIESLARTAHTDRTGAAVIEVDRLPRTLQISARDDRGRTGRLSINMPAAQEASLVLRTDKPVYTGGETIGVQVLAGQTDQVFIDVVKDRQTVLTKTVNLQSGRGAAAIDIPPMLSGTLRLHAYRLDSEGGWVGRDAIVVVRKAGELKVSVSADKKTRRPGEDARVSFRVTDSAGKGLAAAISLAGVDEAVFSLQQSAPGLEGLLDGLDEELLVPAVEVHGFSMALMQQSSAYAQAVLAAAASTAGTAGRRDQVRSPLERLWTVDSPEPAGPLHSLDASDRETPFREYDRARHQAEDIAGTTSVWGAIGILTAIVIFCFSLSSISPPLMGAKRSGRWITGLLVLFVVGWILMTMATPAVQNARRPSGEASEKLADEEPADEAPAGLAWFMVDDNDIRMSAVRAIGRMDIPTGATVTLAGGDTVSRRRAPVVRTRTYFPETMLWRPQIITDPQGRADITVPLADSITTWRLSGSAVSRTGQLGRVSGPLRVFQPFFVDINAPLRLTRGDEVSIPLVFYNYAGKPLAVRINCTGANGLVIADGGADEVNIPANDVAGATVRVKADQIGEGLLTVLAVSGEMGDSIRRSIRIVPPGRPASAVVNGTVQDGRQTIGMPIPADAVDGSIAVRLKLYPSTFSELMDGLEGIFRRPSGCFEQTSSTTYPNVMALAYMKANGLVNPEAAAKATRYIRMGYQRLLTFEVDGGGFDWYGRGPANVALTAYGLMQFADMSRVHNVDPKLLERTANWLAGRQDSSGAWRGGGGFHEPLIGNDSGELAMTAYATWAIATYRPNHSAAQRGAAYIAGHTGDIGGVYTLALCANALKAARSQAAAGLVERLAGKAQSVEKDQACWQTDRGGRRRGHGVKVTALAVLALKGQRQYGKLVNDALRWLAAHRDASGTWGATQSTVLVLKALTEGASGAAEKRDQDISLAIRTVGSNRPPVQVNVSARDTDSVRTAVIEPLTGADRLELEVSAQGADGMAYQVVVHYYTQAATTEARAPVRIEVDYDRSRLQVGQSVTVRATITNSSARTANMLLADVGTPPGFSIDTAGLEKLRSTGKIDRYTVTGTGVIFYVPALAARRSMTLEYRMTAKIPLKAQAAPTTVYPYYQPEQLSAAAATTFMVRQ